MDISIRELRLSLIWLKTLSTHTPMMPLEDSETFKVEFEKARNETSGSLWTPPWNLGREQTFWEFYLYIYKKGPKRLADTAITGSKAWKNLLPLRLRSLGRIKMLKEPEWLADCSAYIEGYRYPHAVAVVVNIAMRVEKDVPATEAVDRMVSLRQQKKWFEAAWLEHGKSSQLALSEVAQKTLDHLGALAFGNNQIEWQIDDYANPFTITTIIDAKNVELHTEPEKIRVPDIKSGDAEKPAYIEFLRALDGLCSGSPDWRSGKLTGAKLDLRFRPREESPLAIPPPSSHVLRATENGRAIWFPKYFGDHFDGKAHERPVLGSYHRHLTLLSLQVEGLITLLQRGQSFMKSGEVPTDLADRIQWACQILGQLYGARGTYRSSSAKEQIETRRNFVNNIRKSLKQKELYPLDLQKRNS